MNSRGMISEVVAAVIAFIALIGFGAAINYTSKARVRSTSAERAHELASRKFESLSNLPFGHADLTLGSHSEPPIVWRVSQDPGRPRLRRIEVNVTALHPVTGISLGQEVGFVGYRYDDF